MKKFPKTIYVVREQDGDSSYLIASDDAGELAEKGVAIMAAEYQLVRPGVVISTEVKVK